MAAGALGPWIALVVSLALVTGGVWWWRKDVFHARQVALDAEPWQQVEEQYPIPPEATEPAELSSQTTDAVLAANPFSADRRAITPVEASGTEAAGPVTPLEPPTPQFTYKGLIRLGQRQRAIVEDVTAHKTHFLEVGQEVAGFKVLDIAENRVVLSDLKTNEEVVVSVTSKANP